MNNKPDKLFKEKLEPHTLQPSAQAWEKVESHLSKKNKMVVWVRVAAAIAALGMLTFVALNWDVKKEEKREIVKVQEQVKPAVVPEVKKEEIKTIANAPAKKRAIEPVAEGKVPEKEKEQAPQPVAVAVAETLPLPPVIEEAKGITLTYSLPSIKKTDEEKPVETTVAEVKKTGLERVLEIAKDVKNADNPLADLRERKDDIFALDFRKDKDKTKKNY